MVYKATLKRLAGIEVFETEKMLRPEEPCQMVAVKELQGNCNHHAKLCIIGRVVTQLGYVQCLENTPKRNLNYM